MYIIKRFNMLNLHYILSIDIWFYTYCHICLLPNSLHNQQSNIHLFFHIYLSHNYDCKRYHMCHHTTLDDILVYIHHFHYHIHFHHTDWNIAYYKFLPSNQLCSYSKFRFVDDSSVYNWCGILNDK